MASTTSDSDWADDILSQLSSAQREELFKGIMDRMGGSVDTDAGESQLEESSEHNRMGASMETDAGESQPEKSSEHNRMGASMEIDAEESKAEESSESNQMSGSVVSDTEKFGIPIRIGMGRCVGGYFGQSDDSEESQEEDEQPEVVTLDDSSESSGPDDDDEYQVITVYDSDDDDDEKRLKQIILRNPTQKLRCHRCLTKKLGMFRDVRKYLQHIKRHTAPDRYNCVTCSLVFTKLNYCISHEIRVHGTDIIYDDKDPVIAYAKKYMEEKSKKSNPPQQAEAAGVADAQSEPISKEKAPSPGLITLDGPEVEDPPDETDPEDEKFYEEQEGRMRINCSNSLMPYRGPKINDFLECYEVQAYHGNPFKSRRAMDISRSALNVHRFNVKYSSDVFRSK